MIKRIKNDPDNCELYREKKEQHEQTTQQRQLLDRKGRLKRWHLKQEKVVKPTSQCCTVAEMNEHDQSKLFVSRLNQFDEELYFTLEMRSRAIAKWKKLRILLVLTLMCSSNSLN